MQIKIDEKPGMLGKIQAGKATLVAGVLGGATNSDGDEVAKYALINEFGSDKIPARPFMRNAVRNNQKKWESQILQAFAAGLNTEQALNAVRNIVRADIIKSIQASTSFKELAPSTIKRKKSMAKKGKMNEQYAETPLIESTALIRSIASEVRGVKKKG